MTIQPTEQDAMLLDAATLAAVESAQEQKRRGEAVTWERVKINVRKQHQAWLNLQREASPT
jgi:hypothetical protein